MPRRGMALLLVVGVLAVLALLAAAFTTLTRLERRAGVQRLEASRAWLLARSGLEDALARLGAGQDPSEPDSAYGGENWDGSADGLLSPTEAAQEVFHPTGAGTPADQGTCPPAQALRPSFWIRNPSSGRPQLSGVDGRGRALSGNLGSASGGYALQVEDLNARIHVNGGALTPGAACRDASPDGPNGFLVRLLDNLERAVEGSAAPVLGTDLVGRRPLGGYRTRTQLRNALGPARADRYEPFLTLRAWVDPTVLRPQPVDGRPCRFLDVDPAHRADGGQAVAPSSAIDSTGFQLRWERAFVYAARQLRLAPPEFEPRAPVSVNAAAEEVLAAVFLGLRGTYLETWDGSAGWDGGFGWSKPWVGGPVQASYPYPSEATEEAPWYRCRADYGMPYGGARPWYGPSDYDPAAGGGGKPVPWAAPLGRLATTPPISPEQARAVASEVRARIREKGPFRSWEDFRAFVSALPAWEDTNGDGILDGAPYTVRGSGDQNAFVAGVDRTYRRRRYDREDANSDGRMNREVFMRASGGWDAGDVRWVDCGAGATAPGDVPGLTRFQKDLLRAMANPNADLNDFNPDANLFKEIDKSDLLAHTTELALDPPGLFEIRSHGRIVRGGRLYARRGLRGTAAPFTLLRHTTQADFMAGFLQAGRIDRVFPPVAAPYGISGNQPLVSYPEPQTAAGARAADADYDGQVGLGFIAPAAAPDERIRGSLFDSLDARESGDPSVPDVRGPFQDYLVPRTSLATPGSLFPDGAYGEKDATLKFAMPGNFEEWPLTWTTMGVLNQFVFCAGFWVKPNWFPEASPRPHALLSLAPSVSNDPVSGYNAFQLELTRTPLDAIRARPVGLFFVPARNNFWQSDADLYVHNNGSARGGKTWACRSLLWGTTHSLVASHCVNRRGLLNSGRTAAGTPTDWNAPVENPLPARVRPVGQLEGHRWVHVAVVGKGGPASFPPNSSRVILGRWNAPLVQFGQGLGQFARPALLIRHDDGTDNHLRLGEVAAEHNLNFVADATFANLVQCGRTVNQWSGPAAWAAVVQSYEQRLTGASGPAATGRYVKEDGAAYVSSRLPAGLAPLRITWTEIPADLWEDRRDNDTGAAPADGWPDTLENDRFGPGGAPGPNGLRDVRIALEAWDDQGTAAPADDIRMAAFDRAEGANRPGLPMGRLYYKAVFVNEWSAAVRGNTPLDVTPFLDDVTVVCASGGTPLLDWGEDGA